MKKERKPLTTREKVLIGLSIAGAVATAGYFGYKYFENAKLVNKMSDELGEVIKDKCMLTESINTLMEAASEGVFEDAIGTTNNKINYRVDKKKYLMDALELNPNDVDVRNTLNKVNIELENLFRRKDKFTKAQMLYEIRDEI